MAAVIVPIIPAILRHQKRIIAALRAAGATEPARAASVDELAVHAGQALRILRRHEIVRDAGDQKLWLDEAAWSAHEARRVRFAVRFACVMATLVLGGLVALWIAKR